MDATLHRPSPRLAQHLPVALALVAGLALSVGLFQNARKLEQRRIQLEFDNLASGLNTALQRRVAANIEVLQSISSFYAASKEVDANEFGEFTHPSLKAYPGIRWLACAPRVPADRVREHMEEAAKLETPPGYLIRGPDGRPMPFASTRPTTSAGESTQPATAPSTAPALVLPFDMDEMDDLFNDDAAPPDLFPVHFISPFEENRSLAGIDLDAFAACRDAMAKSIAENRVIATGPVAMLAGGPPNPGGAAAAASPFDALVFLPIYAQRATTLTDGDRPQNLRGFAVAALRFRDLMDSALQTVDAGGQEIRLHDRDEAGEARLLYRSIPADASPLRHRRDDLETRPWTKPLTIAGRELIVMGLPTPERIAVEKRGGPLAVLGGGILCTLLLSAYLRAMSGRAASVATLVERRTTELTKANSDLEKQVAERRDAEKALSEAEAVYHSLVETLPQNIFRKDLLGHFTFGNRHFCQELRTTPEEVVGKTDLDFFPPELASRYRDDDRQVIESGKTMDLVEEHIKPDGDKLYVQVMKTPVYGPSGGIAGTQGIFWDVTDRKLAEQELEKKNRQLEEAARSERLAHQALQYAHDELKRTQGHLVQSEKMVGLGQMVAGVAHEINNPLAFVGNNVAVLQHDLKAIVELLKLYQESDPLLAEQRPELAARIRELGERVDLPYTLENLDELIVRSRDGLKRIQQIVKDLRNFARLDEADLHDVDLNQGIESTINIVLGHAKKKQVRIEKELTPIPTVSCYPAKVNQVVMNLITNAIDASHENGRVRVRTFVANGDGDLPEEDATPPTVRIEVIDEGSGIEPGIRQRIFNPFFTTKAPGHGTGLGLSISYGIIQDHGGTIEVESTPGKGSTFTIVLPVKGK